MSFVNCFQIIKLSHKKYRALLKKFRRKRIRQKLAKERDEIVSTRPEEEKPTQEITKTAFLGPVDERLKWHEDEKEREIQHNLWLEREKKAQEEFIKEKERKEKIRNEITRREKIIRAEWEKEQEKQKNENDKKTFQEQTKKEREAALLKEISTHSNKSSVDGPTHNPEPPVNFGIEFNRENCPFFFKTGACRFGERCSRFHDRPVSSNTILIPNMYSHFSIEESFRDEYDTDIGLEYEDTETYNHFREFYEDVASEFKKIGRVVQFKTCCNHEPHLRGNVYVQYQYEEDALSAFQKFNGRWYAGKQISCEFTSISKWKTAICGLFAGKRCPKGRSCNFLHVFRNPRNEFHSADFDYLTTPLNSSQRYSRSKSSSHQNTLSRRYRSRSRSRSPSIRRKEQKRSRSRRSRSSSCETQSSSDGTIKRKRSASRSSKKSKKRKKKKSHHHSHHLEKAKNHSAIDSCKELKHKTPS